MFWPKYNPINERGQLVCHDCGHAGDVMYSIWCKVDGMAGDPHCCETGHPFILYCFTCLLARAGRFLDRFPKERVAARRVEVNGLITVDMIGSCLSIASAGPLKFLGDARYPDGRRR